MRGHMTELIMRMDAVKLLISYNQDKLVEMEDLIKQNEQLQVDMVKYQGVKLGFYILLAMSSILMCYSVYSFNKGLKKSAK